MSATELKTIIGTVLIDRKFCEALLNEKRHVSLMEFDLTDEEQEVILNIEADSIQESAVRLYDWLTA